MKFSYADGGWWIVDLESHKGYQLDLVQMASAKVKVVMSLCMPQRRMQECHYKCMSGQRHATVALVPVAVTKLQAGCLRNQFFLKRFIAQKIQRDTQGYKIVPLTNVP